MQVAIDQVKVGARDRTDLGDIAELADSVAAVGLLHPIVVTEDMTLVAGDRRLSAVRHLGWTEVPVTVVETVHELITAVDHEQGWRHDRALSPYEASVIREQRVRALQRWTDADRKTALYRLFSADGSLLYVGITFNPAIRFSQHAKVKSWWPEVAEFTIEWFDSRRPAETAEAISIRDEAPRHNIARPVAALVGVVAVQHIEDLG